MCIRDRDPQDWWNAVCEATRKIIEGIDKKDVLAISFSSQMQACIAVDLSLIHILLFALSPLP